MKKHKKIKSYFELKELVIIVCAFVIMASSVTGYAVYLYINGKYQNSQALKDIIKSYNQIKRDYYEEIDEEKLSSSAIDGMMKYLNENYSEYLSDEETNSLNEKLNSTYKGIGIRIIDIDGTISIYEVFKDSPAEKAGLKVDDILLEVDKQEVKDLSLNEIVNIIKDSDKEVLFRVRREDEELKFTVSVEDIDTPVTSATIIDEKLNIGYISLTNFSSTAYKQFKNSLDSIESKKIKSLIIDLRDNTGGYLKEAESIASIFLNKGKIIYYLDTKNKKTKYVDKNNESRDYPIVILVNSQTASSSEILASALKESYGAILVGEKTYGKGKVQQTSKLSDNQSIKYTTAKWYTPRGECVDGVGINPGIKVQLSDKYYENPSQKNDNQLKEAIDVLKEYK